MELKYNWEKLPEVKIFLEKIYKNSQLALKVTNHSIEYADEFILDIEEFLQYIKTHYNTHFNEILDKLTELEYISFQVPYALNKEGTIKPDYEKMPSVINLTTKILLNPTIKEDEKLTAREKRKYELYKGLLSIIIKLKNPLTRNFSKIYTENLTVKKVETEATVNNGWLLLENILIKELTRMITSEIIKKEVPGIDTHSKNSKKLDLEKKAHAITLMFGMTISNVGSVNEHSKYIIIYSLIKKAFSDNLSQDVFSEYYEKGKEFELYKILYGMGLIANEMYATTGFRLISNIKLQEEEIKNLYKEIIKELSKMITLEENNYSKEISVSPKKSDIKTKEKLLDMIYDKKISN